MLATNNFRYSLLFHSMSTLAVIGLLGGCSTKSVQKLDKDSLPEEKALALTAFADYQEDEHGADKIGALTKDEFLDRYGVAKLGLAFDERCSLISTAHRSDLSMKLTAVDEAISALKFEPLIIKRLQDGARVIAANLGCEEAAKANVERADKAVDEMCAAMGGKVCAPVAPQTIPAPPAEKTS